MKSARRSGVKQAASIRVGKQADLVILEAFAHGASVERGGTPTPLAASHP